jgi:hypothetical protein
LEIKNNTGVTESEENFLTSEIYASTTGNPPLNSYLFITSLTVIGLSYEFGFYLKKNGLISVMIPALS